MKLSINSVLLLAGTLLGGFLIYFFAFGEVSGRAPLDGLEDAGAAMLKLPPELDSEGLSQPASSAPAQGTQRLEMRQPKDERQLAREAKAQALEADPGPMLFGTILDPTGFAVGDAQVEVSAQGKAKNLFGMIVDNFSKKTTSGSAGHFEVPRSWITNDEVSVKVTARGYEIWNEDREPSEPSGRADLGIIELQPAVVLGGVVLDSNGTPVEGVKVMRVERGGDASRMFFGSMGGGTQTTASTDAEGRFEMAHEVEGEYDLVTKHESYPQQRYEGETPAAGAEDLSIVIRLDASASLSGRIIGFPRGMPRIVVQASPAVRREDEELRGIALFIPAADAKSPSAPVAADGSFRVEGLLPGKLYTLKAMQQKGFMDRAQCSDLQELISGQSKVELTWQKGATLAIQVEDSRTGDPVGEGSVRFLWKASGGMMGGMPRQRPFSAGSLRIDELRPEPSPGKLQLVVHAPGYQEQMIDDVSIGQGEDVVLPSVRLQQAALLRVRVLDASDGTPLRRAFVELSPIATSDEDGAIIEGRKSDGNTDKEGWVSLESCSTATANLAVKKGGYGDYLESDVVMPSAASRELTVELIPGGKVEAYVVDRAGRPVKNSRVYALLSSGDQRMEETNSKGRAKFSSLIPGEHRFRGDRFLESNSGMQFSTNRADLWDEELDWTTVLVSSKATTKVTLRVPSASGLGGRITAAGRPLAGASVRLLQQRESKAEMDAEFELASSMEGSFSGVSSSSKTDSNGAFSLSEVPVGSHVLYVVSQSGSLPHTFEVQVLEGTNFVDLELPVASVSGIVTDTTGRPVRGARIYARRSDAAKEGPDEGDLEVIRSMFGRVDQGSVKTDSKGLFTIPNVSPEVPLVVSVSCSGYVADSSEELTVKQGQVYEGLAIKLTRAGSIRVNASAGAQRFVVATATYAGEAEGAPADTSSRGWGQGGTVLIKDLAPGLWRVSLNEQDEGGEASGTLVEVFPGTQAVVNL